MVAIETSGHVDKDGMLRLEVPVPQRDRDVQVVVVVQTEVPPVAQTEAPLASEAKDDPWAEWRKKKLPPWLKLPEPGSRHSTPPEPFDAGDGLSASDMLVEDRR